jgi:tetratricopeptide (TPR) repeat protein
MNKIIGTILTIALLSANIIMAQSADSYYNTGMQLKTNKKSTEALVEFKKALALDANDPKVLYEMGWCYNDTKDYKNAAQVLQKARIKWSNIPKVHFELGYAFQFLNQLDSAKASYNNCLFLKQDYKLAYKQLGYVMYEESQNTKAIDYLNKYISLMTNLKIEHMVWYKKGFCHNALKQYDSASLALNNALLLNNTYVNTYLELGFAQTKLNKDNAKAIGYFKQAMMLDKSNHVAYNGIAEIFRDNYKNCDSAVYWYNEALKIKPKERKATYGIGYCFNTKQQYAAAIPYLETAIAQEKTYTAAYIELGYAHYKLKNYQIAETNFNTAISINSSNQNALYYKALLLIELNKKSDAQKVIDSLKAINAQLADKLQKQLNNK